MTLFALVAVVAGFGLAASRLLNFAALRSVRRAPVRRRHPH